MREVPKLGSRCRNVRSEQKEIAAKMLRAPSMGEEEEATGYVNIRPVPRRVTKGWLRGSKGRQWKNRLAKKLKIEWMEPNTAQERK